MEIKEQILKALQSYKIGENDTVTFCDAFMRLYYYEPSGYRYFDGEERKYLDELAAVVERFSPHKEDFVTAPNMYYSEEQVREKFHEVISKLGI